MNNLSCHPIATYHLPRLSKLVSDAIKDTDAASFTFIHADDRSGNWKETCALVKNRKLRADGAIIIVKGRVETLAAFEALCAADLITSDKPITGPKEAA